MTNSVPDILAAIVDHKRHELSLLRSQSDHLESLAAQRTARRDFAAALRLSPPAVISEIKQASPSRGTLSTHFNPASLARQYEAGGAAALSVLTDQKHFRGHWDHLLEARATVSIPVLRKDFTVDPLHVIEAAAYGADAILLIAAILTERELRDLRELAEAHQLAVLVEVHDDQELPRAIASGARIIGVNNRDLRTFEVSLDTSLRLAEQLPNEVIRVCESGIHRYEDVARLLDAGYTAFLVGEHLVRSGEPALALQRLRGVVS